MTLRPTLRGSVLALALLVGLILSSCATRATVPTPAPVLVLISLDAFRWDYCVLHPNETPRLRELIREGSSAQALIPVYPSNTFPNHYTIVTGLYPSHHGIINNDFFDPAEGRYFHYNIPGSAQDKRWWKGEPIWVTAIKQGKKAASAYWIGSEAEIAGVRPTFWRAYDPKVTFETRFNELARWLRLPTAERPAVITFYLEETNSIGHKFGPDSPELTAAIKLQDGRIGALVDLFKSDGIPANFVIVSDHGMTPISTHRVMLLDDFIDPASVQLDFFGPAAGLRPINGDTAALMNALRPLTHATAYRREDLPSHFHISSNPRNPPVWIVPDEGWEVYFRSYFNLYRDKFNRGDHGYDPALPSMHGIFIASGPSFRQGVVTGPVENIYVYNLLCAALGLTPAPNDGDDRLIRAMLRK